MAAPILLPDTPAALPATAGGMSSTTPMTNPPVAPVAKPVVLGSQYVPAPAPTTAKTSGTVLSNANVIENTIPSLNARANALQPNAPTMLVPDNPNPPAANGTPAPPDETQDPIFKQEMDMINGLRSSNDAASNASVDSIMRNYQNLAGDLGRKQEGTDAMVANALLRGGTTRYAPGNAGQLLSTQHYGDIEEIGRLQDEENSKIAAVRQAQATQNYSLVEKTLGELDTIRANKQAATAALATKMQTARDQQVQSSRDSAVANLVASGVTDPKALLQHLNFDPSGRQIGNFTADEISKTLLAIQKNTGIPNLASLSGATKNFFVLKQAGQLPGTIASLPENEQLNAFLKGNYSATHKGTAPTGVTPVSPTTKFTVTQTNKGASNAGLPVASFSKLTPDDKNYFINGYAHFTTALKSVQAGTHTQDELKAAIDSAPISQQAKDILYGKAGISTTTPVAPQSPSLFSEAGAAAGSALDYVRHLVGI